MYTKGISGGNMHRNTRERTWEYGDRLAIWRGGSLGGLRGGWQEMSLGRQTGAFHVRITNLDFIHLAVESL